MTHPDTLIPRAEFEAWYMSHKWCDKNLTFDRGGYVMATVQLAWQAWQASRAALQPQACKSKPTESGAQDSLIVKYGGLQAAAEPVCYQSRMRPLWGQSLWTEWAECSKGTFEVYQRMRTLNDWEFESRTLYTTPPAAPPATQAALDRMTTDRDEWKEAALAAVRIANSQHDKTQAALTAALSVLLDIRDGMGITGGGIDAAIAQIEALGE